MNFWQRALKSVTHLEKEVVYFILVNPLFLGSNIDRRCGSLQQSTMNVERKETKKEK